MRLYYLVLILEATIIMPKYSIIFLYHKGNIEGIKDDLVTFQNICFEICEDNWSHFKSSLLATIVKRIPQKVIKSKHDLPWLNHVIKQAKWQF